MTERSILIIGAGIGGLSTGCYARMNGYRATILEMHDAPGGMCTSWKRHGYTFDGCIHNLAGTTPASVFHAMWRELGVIPAVAMHSFEELVRVERPEGGPLTVYTDLDRLQRHLTELAPADAKVIDELIGAARHFATFDLLGLALAGPLERARALAMLPRLLKYSRVTLGQFAQRFTDPFLRRAFPTLVYDWPQIPVAMLLTFLGRTHIGDYGWPAGGSIAVARAIERRFLELGGQIRYHAQVQSILVENDRAAGVRLTDGSEHRADIVVSNANGHATIFEMLGGRYTSPAIRSYYRAPEDRIEMGIHVSLGVARDLSQESHAIVLSLEQPVIIAGEARHRLYVEPFGFDPSLAPPGKTALKVVMATSFDHWQRLHEEPERYAQEKRDIAEAVISLLERRFPKLRDDIEVVDVATPMTTLRFTGNGHGYRSPIAAMALALFTGRRLSQTLPGLADFYMVGQWAGVAGVPLVAAMGRDVVRAICRSDRRAFTIIAPAAARQPRTSAA
ncbi:MAG TPA: NAD(P)/FAD-dependent oxidoreductase [Hyphomicrobiaceae bacterium]|jgi:phytoene dehydrogenase-like protein